MRAKPANGTIAAQLLLAVFLWGANNTACEYLVQHWPPAFVGATRFLASGLVLFALLRWTRFFGGQHDVSPDLRRRLWRGGGLTMALYILCFNYALKWTAVSHVVLYLGAAPVWALIWEERPQRNWRSAQRYSAAALALCGVLVLFCPQLRSGQARIYGELLGLTGSVLWTTYGRQCRALSSELSSAEISAHTFWRAALIMAPFGLIEVAMAPPAWNATFFLLQLFCVLGSGVLAFGLWNNGLRHWKTSEVYLFNNLIPLSTMTWARFCLNEQISHTFWVAMILIASGVILGQTKWERILGAFWVPSE